MKLCELLQGVVVSTDEFEVCGITLDSRDVKPGYVFAAVAGSRKHGLQYAQKAIDLGVSVIIYDPAHGGAEMAAELNGCISIAVTQLNEKLGHLGANFYFDPSAEMSMLGITGTNGKTSCSQFLAQSLEDCGVIGTLGWGESGCMQKTQNTTPDALTLQKMLRQLQQQRKKRVVMEVSSHGLAQGRVNGVHFKGVLFTNLSRDHLDYHGSMARYLEAKIKLMTWPDLSFAVVNIDDQQAPAVINRILPGVKIWGFSKESARASETIEMVTAEDISVDLGGIGFKACWRDKCGWVKTRIAGEYNVDNLLAVLTVMLALEMPFDQALRRLHQLQPVSGRMEAFGGQGQPDVFIDYAHTPDALEKLLKGIKPYCKGKLKLVFGCGGDRDQGKRTLMGQIAARWADDIMLTDDNPRHESPENIIGDIVQGCRNASVKVCHDRGSAIKQTLMMASVDDCVVIAGKGHENYQEIKGIRKPFSDQETVTETLTLIKNNNENKTQ